MSFSRFAADDSDVYTFPCVSGYYECCGCHLDGTYRTRDAALFLAHLADHEDAGHTVPTYTRDAVRAWAAEHPDGWERHASFRFAGAGTYHGIVRDGGRTIATCPHRHTTTDLARACGQALMKETP